MDALSDRESEAFKYLFEGYSEAWTAETLGLGRREARKLFASVYRKLEVDSPRELILSYAPQGSSVFESGGLR